MYGLGLSYLNLFAVQPLGLLGQPGMMPWSPGVRVRPEALCMSLQDRGTPQKKPYKHFGKV